jgi:ankyrin repeat protein
VNARDDHQWTPLIQAASASQESKKMVEALLAHGADINAMAMNGYTPLIEAAMMGHRDVVEIFLAHGADVNAKEEGQYTAFRWAMSGNHQDIVDLLRQHGGHE